MKGRYQLSYIAITKISYATLNMDYDKKIVNRSMLILNSSLPHPLPFLCGAKVLNTQRRLGDAEERAMTAMRDLRLSRDALRVQADLSKAASSAAATTSRLSQSPGTSVRFPASTHDLPLAASPVLRAPPPVRWGSGPVLPGGGVVGGGGNGDGDLDGSARGPGGGEMLVLRTQEMGVRFALDTLRYSEDEEVVVFMLHLVQVRRMGPFLSSQFIFYT